MGLTVERIANPVGRARWAVQQHLLGVQQQQQQQHLLGIPGEQNACRMQGRVAQFALFDRSLILGTT
ncbi:hypothetical protein CIB48_g1167 [Xylaria polymorpha]|nr:hypothetical protein CIB48_g1167 [Xylaria polymorpha]